MNLTRYALAGALLCGAVHGQQTIGRVALSDAAVTGTLTVSDGRATLQDGASIVARAHPADLVLERGGGVRVCSTSSLHVTAGASSGLDRPPLLLALDRGAMEIHAAATARDVVMTPDLRMTMASAGPLDLQIRVTPNGDTCVENRGLQAPALDIINQFGDEHYQLRAGQHVLFEHGSLREVVDHESSSCGCPPAPAVSVAQAVDGTNADRPAPPGAAVAKPGDNAQSAAEAQHPFPAAESQDLAAEGRAAAVPQAAPGQPHAQVAATLAYDASANASALTVPPPPPSAATAPPDRTATATVHPAADRAVVSPPAPTAVAPESPASPPVQATPPLPDSNPAAVASIRAEAPPPPPAPAPHDVLHSIGRFFRHLFGGR